LSGRLSDGAEPAGGDDDHVDPAIQHLFQQAELFAAGEDATRLGGIFTQTANNPNSPAATEKTQRWRGKPAAVQSIGGAQNAEHQSKGCGIADAAQGRIILGGGNESAMPKRQIGQGATLLFIQGEIGVSPDHAGAHGVMFSFIDGPADVVDESREFQKPNLSPRQIV